MTNLIINNPNILEKYPNHKIIIDFYADWCGPCKMFAPIFEDVAQESRDENVIFGKIDVDKFPDFAKTHNVQSIPTVIFFKKSKEENRHLGYFPKSKFITLIESF